VTGDNCPTYTSIMLVVILYLLFREKRNHG